MQNFIELRAAVLELSCAQGKKLRRKQYSPSLPMDSALIHVSLNSNE